MRARRELGEAQGRGGLEGGLSSQWTLAARTEREREREREREVEMENPPAQDSAGDEVKPTATERKAQVNVLVVASEAFQTSKNLPLAGIRAKMEAKEVSPIVARAHHAPASHAPLPSSLHWL